MSLDEDVNLKLSLIWRRARAVRILKALSTEAGMYAIREERTIVYQSDFEGAAIKILHKEEKPYNRAGGSGPAIHLKALDGAPKISSRSFLFHVKSLSFMLYN